MTTPAPAPTTPITPDSIVSQMRAALALSEPDLDTSIGSTTRKILDAVASQIAPAYSDQYLLDYSWNIDSKTGSDLDDFVAILGFTRLPAGRATGIVTFGRTTSTAADVQIPAGVQVTSPDGSVIVATVVPTTLVAGGASVDVPVQSIVAGVAGNATAYTLTLFATQLDGITSVVNTSALSGGTDPETDAALITRFKATALRSLAGTETMYLAIALDPTSIATDNTDAVVTAANVLGGSRRWREQVQIAEDGTATSTIPTDNVQYVFSGTEIFGADIDNGDILTDGVHYSFDAAIPPVIATLHSALVVGDLYDLDFEYVPSASRNDAANGITNRVDVWVTGVDATVASQVSYFNTAKAFNDTDDDPLLASNFIRLNSADVAPTVGNIFVQLGYGPILTFPSALTIDAVTYVLGTDYWIVHDDTAFGYSPTSLYGLEWLVSHAPSNGTQISLTDDTSYTYNYVPWSIGTAIQMWRMVCTDVQVHAAKQISILVNLVVMMQPHVDQTVVTNALTTAISAWFAANGFDAALQVSDVLQVAHGVGGVDNVRFATSTDDADVYAWQRLTPDGDTTITTYETGGRATDIILGDDEIPVLYGLNISIRAQNTYSAGA